MPWGIKRGAGNGCPSSKPIAVINKETGEKVGCHESEGSARDQIAALNANVKEK